MRRRGVDLRDSLDDDPSTLPAVSLPCPSCGVDVVVEASHVVRNGDSTGLDPDLDVEPWRTLIAAGVVSTRSRGWSTTVVDDDDLAPHVLSVRCGSCGADAWATAGWGEFQPARYRCTMWPLVKA
jgi:hypothetical protein